MCQLNPDGTMIMCDGDCPHKGPMTPRSRADVRALHNPWNDPHHPGHNSDVAVQEGYRSIEGGTAAMTHAVYPNAGPPPSSGYQPEGENPDPLSPHAAHSFPMTADRLVRQLDRIAGILTTHQETFDQYRIVNFVAPNGLAVGTDLVPIAAGNTNTALGFNAKSFIVHNFSGYQLIIPGQIAFIPKNTVGFIVACFPSTRHLQLQIFGGAQATPTNIFVIATERLLGPGSAVWT